MWYVFKESGCLGMQPKMGGKFHLKLNIGERPIANKYREGKMKRTLKRELNSTWNCQKGNAWNQYVAGISRASELWFGPQGRLVICVGCTCSSAGQHQFRLLEKAPREGSSFGCVIALEWCSGRDWGFAACALGQGWSVLWDRSEYSMLTFCSCLC